jgi:hypothetical protein
MPLQAFDNIRKVQRYGDGPRSRYRSRRFLERLSSFGLPQSQQIADVNICFQLGLFRLSQHTLVRFAV